MPPVDVNRFRWKTIARLGPGAFGTISGEVVKAILFTADSIDPHLDPDTDAKTITIRGIDVSMFEGGLKDGFSVLVNYHKLDNKLLKTLIYTYLNDWIVRQRSDRDAGVGGSEEKLAAAHVRHARHCRLSLDRNVAGTKPTNGRIFTILTFPQRVALAERARSCVDNTQQRQSRPEPVFVPARTQPKHKQIATTPASVRGSNTGPVFVRQSGCDDVVATMQSR